MFTLIKKKKKGKEERKTERKRTENSLKVVYIAYIRDRGCRADKDLDRGDSRVVWDTNSQQVVSTPWYLIEPLNNLSV